MGRLIDWIRGKGDEIRPVPGKSPGELTDAQTIELVRRRLEAQSRRIAILDAKIDAQRVRH